MKKYKTISASSYYFSSIFTLLANFNFWVFPLVFFGKKPILIKLKNGLKFYVSNPMDIWTLKEVIIERQYEPIDKVMKGDVVVDIGASIGDFSIYSAKKAEEVIAYEFSEERLELMGKNINLNKVSNITTYKAEASNINDIMEDIDICHFMKIDCEGCEYKIFEKPERSVMKRINYIAMKAHLFDEAIVKKFNTLVEMFKENNFIVSIRPSAISKNICFLFASNTERV